MRTKSPKKTNSFPDDWDNLINSFEPYFENARKNFSKDKARKLAQYITSEKYVPWSKSVTWRHVGVPNETNERKKLGPVISLFRKWRFIEEEEGSDKHIRVEESIPYLKKLYEK